YNTVDGVCFCSVGGEEPELGSRLQNAGVPVLRLTSDTPVPIGVEYGSRATLGADRLAAAAGVAGDTPVLVVDAGTAVTIDLVAGNTFLGGNISPGLRLRFRSLNAFTSRLPLVGPEGELPEFGNDTVTAIRSGVMRGLAGELAAAYMTAQNRFENIKMVLTGGDAAIFQPMLAQRGIDVVADPEAVGRGLVRIFNYNIEL
ncbi:MAG: type III pantothenate kinase, partial [Muribaculaceae bacterium]|nr:type III pantothenate kinase [Muribaculaceae bacterium]